MLYLQVIVSNNSADIAKFFATEFRQFSPVKDTLDLCPADTKDKVLAQCDRLAQDVNIQVYKAHFCPEQKVFEELCEQFWGTLDEFENLLSKQRFVLGEQMSLADIFLYVTIIRFDIVYGPMFRLNKRNVRFEMPHLWGHTRRVFQAGGDKVSHLSHLAARKHTHTQAHTLSVLTKRVMPKARSDCVIHPILSVVPAGISPTRHSSQLLSIETAR